MATKLLVILQQLPIIFCQRRRTPSLPVLITVTICLIVLVAQTFVVNRRNYLFRIDEETKIKHDPLSNITTSIIVLYGGELGNLLSRISRGIALQLWAQREYGLTTELVLRDNGSREGGPRDIKKCFPKLRQYDLRRGNTPEYKERVAQQHDWLGESLQQTFYMKTSRAEDIEHSLTTLREFLLSQRNNATLERRFNQTLTSNETEANSNISFPFLTVDGDFVMVDVWADKYYDDWREMFQFDFEACCKLKPKEDESVFHFRNFKTEMHEHADRLGFHELDPHRVANELFWHLQPGDKVAITSRFGTDPSTQAYADALTNRSLEVRVITGQSGAEDFCFLMHTKKELVGMAESTYALWAGYLGNATKVRLYSMDTPGRRQSPLFSHRVFVHYNWTNPKLQQKIFFELYDDEGTKNSSL